MPNRREFSAAIAVAIKSDKDLCLTLHDGKHFHLLSPITVRDQGVEFSVRLLALRMTIKWTEIAAIELVTLPRPNEVFRQVA